MKDKPNLIVVFADQWRRQAVGCYNADPVITPNMDAFAAEGMLFENAFSCNPVCTPNRAALLTGKHPFSVNMMYNWLRLPVEEDTIAKACGRAGYDTGYIGKWHLDDWDGNPKLGDAWNAFTPAGERRAGFEYWYSHGCNHKHFTLKYLKTDDTFFEGEGWQVEHETDIAIDYIKNTDSVRDSEKPFCLFLAWSPPHTPYKAPEEYEKLYRDKDLPVPPNTNKDMFLDAAPGYFGAVTGMDEHFGRLMQCLKDEGLEENTVVALTADHGECLGAHGKYIKDVWWEESVGIPFIVRYPKAVPAGKRENMLFNTPDMMPSLLGLMDVEIPEGCYGTDFSHIMRGEGGERRTEAFFSFNAGAPPKDMVEWDVFPIETGREWRAVRTDRYTYVAAARGQYGDPKRFCKPMPAGVKQFLIDNENDPWQVNPFYPGQGKDDIIKELHAKLETWLNELGDPFLTDMWH